jgi:hypothetical protein
MSTPSSVFIFWSSASTSAFERIFMGVFCEFVFGKVTPSGLLVFQIKTEHQKMSYRLTTEGRRNAHSVLL